MKIWVLMENTARDAHLAIEHGLSLYIETERHRILFDMGQSSAFAENAAKMGVDLSKVDIAVLSHGHYDHGGGLARFLEINGHAPVYLSRHAFGGHYNAKGSYIGLDPALEGHPRLIPTGDRLEIDDELCLCSLNDAALEMPIDSAGLTVQAGQGMQPEAFRHEQYLIIREGGREVAVSGCAHKGVCNIAAALRPDVLIGGFHFKGIDPAGPGRQAIENAARRLADTSARYYTCHCTGVAQYELMKVCMGAQLEYAACGDVFEI